ncbi:MAG: hypothetical protein IKL08_03050, partial [Clostridia bacterium]|nr:hypothetical protein [Clostridia bacterium]
NKLPKPEITGGERGQLGIDKNINEETIDILDEIDIDSVDLDLRPYDWEVNGKTGRSAYLQAINVRQNIDRFGAMYAEDME